jgi:hypothetical protein
MDLNDLSGKAVAFVVVGVILSVGTTIIFGARSGAGCSNSTATVGQPGYCGYEIYKNSGDGLGTIAGYLPTIGLVVAAAVVIGTLFMAFKK